MKNPERKFLHDLSNIVAICYGNVKILSTKLGKDPDSVTPEYLNTRLGKALDGFEKMNNLLAQRRETLISEEENGETVA